MEMNNKKSIAQKFNIHFFIVALAIAIGVYIALADSGKYVSSLDIILIPKNEKTATHIDKVKGNIVTIFEKTSEISNVSIKTNETNTLISIESKKYNRGDAVSISKKTSREVIEIASKYYSAKKDLDLRIVNVEVEKSKNNIFIVVILSAIFGGIISFLVQGVIGAVENSAVDFIKKRKDEIEVSKDIEGMLTKNRSKIEELSYFPKAKKEEIEYGAKEFPVTVEEIESGSKKASSPQNLPVENFDDMGDNANKGGESVPSNLPFEVIEENESTHSFSEHVTDLGEGEPTEEEYRERLNQLLKGE